MLGDSKEKQDIEENKNQTKYGFITNCIEIRCLNYSFNRVFKITAENSSVYIQA